jgi:hypothetical protein
MIELKRLTTQYDPAEDRIFLAVADDQGQALRLWLTQRLINRLVPHLCEGLEKRGGTATDQGPVHSLHSQVAQSFAQQQARATLQRERPVVPAADAPQWRVEAVDVSYAAGGARLNFKGTTEAQQALLALPTPALRQWLGIVFEQYRRAGWQTQVWPAWMEEAAVPSPSKALVGVLH